MCYRNHFVRLYTIMDCVSEIFRCFCFFSLSPLFYLSIYIFLFLLYCSTCLLSFWIGHSIVQHGTIVWIDEKGITSERRVIFYFSHDFLNEDNAIYIYGIDTHTYCVLVAICFMMASVCAFVSNANICLNFIRLLSHCGREFLEWPHPVLYYSSISQVERSVCVYIDMNVSISDISLHQI